ncbi:hypothetical protein [Geomonas subterranea]|uniref:DUF2157 domain-containing protein n=1 Tax=Geomonas subterranea TaxID=2847989 RepID=A0ABX8LH12_9BACT|nr:MULTISPECIES: hypothetical protein [Geomonas]QXE91267.1 hypothetical protein KP001_01620 [Geomonas subterranea]QXM10646.1 hypothetical protein KP002_05875 [Geomonas subterranea]
MIRLYEKGERRVAVVEEARRWQEAGIITPEQAAAVAERYRPELVRVNVFIRILLALFTTVVVAALVALPAVMFNVKEDGFTVLCLIFAPLCAWVADHELIAGRRLYRCGAEEALLLLAVGMLALAVAIPAHHWGHSAERLAWLAAHVIILAGAVMLTVRYGYALAAFGAMLALAGLPFHLADVLLWQSPGLSRLVLLLLLGAAAIWAQLRLTGRNSLPRGYVWSLESMRLAAWTGIYLDVNLFAHRLLWREWLGWIPGEWQLPWSDPLCALLTAILPVAALAMGIGRRDRALLWFGVVSSILSIITLKYYIHFGHLAEELTAAGLLLAGLAFGLLRWLRAGSKRCRGAFTAEPLLEPRLYGLDAEALAAIQPLTPAANVPQAKGFQPGGGTFGGGGASGSY